MARDGEDAGVFGRSLRASAAAALVVVATALVVWEGRTLLVVLAGVLAALALRGPSRWIAEKARVPYPAALATLVAAVLVTVGLALYFLGAGLSRQADAFAEQVPAAWGSMVDALKQKPALARLAPAIDRQVPPPFPTGATLLSGAGGVLEAVGALVVVFFVAVYGAASPDAYGRVVLALVPSARRDEARAVLDDIGASLTRWLGGRAVAMVIVGVIVASGLYAMRIPLAGILGIVAGWLTFVEYLGAFVSAAPALLLALSKGPGYALGVAALFLVAHVLEGYVLTPFLVRSTVRIPPGYTLSAQLVMGSIFGVVGLTFATPVTLVATLLVKHLYLPSVALGRSGRVPSGGAASDHVGQDQKEHQPEEGEPGRKRKPHGRALAQDLHEERGDHECLEDRDAHGDRHPQAPKMRET